MFQNETHITKFSVVEAINRSPDSSNVGAQYMPAPKLTKSSIGNAIAALKEQGLTPSRVNMNTDGSFTIDVSADTVTPPAVTHGPKKWGEDR
jgi:hypothetical protein